MTLSLAEQVNELERKAQNFDDAVDRIMELQTWVDDFENGDASPHAVINKVKSLIKFYESSSREWLAKIEEQGYQQGGLVKYTNSTFNGKKIIEVKAMKGGEVFAVTDTGLHTIGFTSDGLSYKQGLDSIICDLQDVEGLKLSK